MENGSVVSNISQGIATITFGHPQSNSLPGVILNKLAEEIRTLGANAEVRVIILRTLGEKTFCAGASFDELVAIKDYESGLEFFSGFAKVINACRTTKQLIIGRIQGKAVGGGVGISAAVDYCFATTQADIKLSELAVGIGPFVVGPAVARKIGVSGMSELAINATAWRSADWAKNKGLYAEVFEDIAAMDEAVDNLAIRLAQSNPEAMYELKRIFWQGTEDWDQLLTERAGISGRLVLSEFTRNAILAFKSK
ncbi:MAG: enoyl-CoA hydratase/isomerase family protein [Crocinitomicaceae bacterium]|nr:enoyl-CoA hydratase/isomerase family protein [Crocinitomicaceae bacterium]